jgi:K+-sensing histidine kinase KdpD
MSEQDSVEGLKQLELAYQMATEMSQFKAGFLARISHELRSPLNGLIGMHQLILSDLCDSPEEEREFIAQAHTSALKLLKILDDILTVARLEHGSAQMALQPIQVSGLLRQVYDLIHLPAEDRNLRVQLLAPDPDLYILADPNRLQQVLVSLVSASIAQMPEGRITLSARSEPDTGYAQIWIEDNCPVEVRSEPIDLLHPPVTGNQVGDHTPASLGQATLSQNSQPALPPPGLNLLISQTLVELMQGRLEVVAARSDSSNLTQIQCSLPLVQEDVE